MWKELWKYLYMRYLVEAEWEGAGPAVGWTSRGRICCCCCTERDSKRRDVCVCVCVCVNICEVMGWSMNNGWMNNGAKGLDWSDARRNTQGTVRFLAGTTYIRNGRYEKHGCVQIKVNILTFLAIDISNNTYIHKALKWTLWMKRKWNKITPVYIT